MIKIHDKLWWVARPNEDNLAYMTHMDNTKGFESRKNTGNNWATGYSGTTDTKENTADNTPQSGFYIGDSVSRWSTSNKLFRVVDPRGFMVEVPTGNIATLLHHTTVVNGKVKEECVWGRDGNNHILLPINSEPYKEAKATMDTISNGFIKASQLTPGDVVKLFDCELEYTFLGRGKPVWEITPFIPSYRRNYHRDRVLPDAWDHTAKVFTNIFKMVNGGYTRLISHTSPRVVEVITKGSGEVYKGELLGGLYPPGDHGGGEYVKYKLKSILWKATKEKR